MKLKNCQFYKKTETDEWNDESDGYCDLDGEFCENPDKPCKITIPEGFK